jgi:hypothetical protein
LLVLDGCETWSVTLKEEPSPMVFKQKLLRDIFVAEWEEVAEDWSFTKY